jgi:hypothetical protein
MSDMRSSKELLLAIDVAIQVRKIPVADRTPLHEAVLIFADAYADQSLTAHEPECGCAADGGPPGSHARTCRFVVLTEPSPEHPPQLMAVVDKWQDYVNDMRNGHIPPYSSQADTVECVLREIRRAAQPPGALQSRIDFAIRELEAADMMDSGDNWCRTSVLAVLRGQVTPTGDVPGVGPCTCCLCKTNLGPHDFQGPFESDEVTKEGGL